MRLLFFESFEIFTFCKLRRIDDNKWFQGKNNSKLFMRNNKKELKSSLEWCVAPSVEWLCKLLNLKNKNHQKRVQLIFYSKIKKVRRRRRKVTSGIIWPQSVRMTNHNWKEYLDYRRKETSSLINTNFSVRTWCAESGYSQDFFDSSANFSPEISLVTIN